MDDKTSTVKSVTIDNPEQASTNFYWTFETQSQVFNLQTTIRGILSFEQVQAHIKSALEATAHIHSLGGLAKQVGKNAYEPTPAVMPIVPSLETVIPNAPTLLPEEPKHEKTAIVTGTMFNAKWLQCRYEKDKKSFKVLGEPPFQLYGVRIWEDVLITQPFDLKAMEVGKDYPLDGYRATIAVNDKGYKKIAKLEKIT